jgi:hypothetical protein
VITLTSVADFPAELVTLLESASKAPVYVPCPTPSRGRNIRHVLRRLAQALRREDPARYGSMTMISIRLYTTAEVTLNDASWNPGPGFPYTVLVDARDPFVDLISKAQPAHIEQPASEISSVIEDPDEGAEDDDIDLSGSDMSSILSRIGKRS